MSEVFICSENEEHVFHQRSDCIPDRSGLTCPICYGEVFREDLDRANEQRIENLKDRVDQLWKYIKTGKIQ